MGNTLPHLPADAAALWMEDMGGTEGHYACSGRLPRHDGLLLLRCGIHIPTVCRQLASIDVPLLLRCLDDAALWRHRVPFLKVSDSQHELAFYVQSVSVAPRPRYPRIPDDPQHQQLDRSRTELVQTLSGLYGRPYALHLHLPHRIYHVNRLSFVIF